MKKKVGLFAKFSSGSHFVRPKGLLEKCPSKLYRGMHDLRYAQRNIVLTNAARNLLDFSSSFRGPRSVMFCRGSYANNLDGGSVVSILRDQSNGLCVTTCDKKVYLTGASSLLDAEVRFDCLGGGGKLPSSLPRTVLRSGSKGV